MRSFCVLIALCVLSGCIRAGFDEDRTPTPDRGMDGPRDVGADAAAVDKTTPKSEAGADGPGDAVLVDLSVNPMDAPTPKACASSMTPALVYGANMVLCSGPTSGFSQCDAGIFCNLAGGWSPCTATQFLARGGKTTPASVEAWLHSCLRDGATSTIPTDTNCSCVHNMGQTLPLGWACGTGSIMFSSAHLHMGVTTSSTCRRLGSSQAVEAYWAPIVAISPQPAAVCCK